jgi:hypothetical protein
MANLYYQPKRTYFGVDEEEEDPITSSESLEDPPPPRFNVESDLTQPAFIPRDVEYDAGEEGIMKRPSPYSPPPPRFDIPSDLGQPEGNPRYQQQVTPPPVDPDSIFQRVNLTPPPPVAEDPQAAKYYGDAMARVSTTEALRPETYRKKKDRWYHNLGRGVLNGVNNFVEQGGIPLLFQNGSTGAGFAVGNMLGGGVSNVLSPYADERLAIRRDQMEARAKLGEAQKTRDADLQRRMAETNMGNIHFDNKLGVENINSRIAGMESKYYTDMAKANASKTAAEIRAVTAQIQGMGSFDPVDHPDLVQRFAELTGGGVLTKKKAKLTKATITPNAENGQLYKHLFFADGTEEKGWVTDGNDRVVAMPPSVRAAIIQATSFANVENIRQQGYNTRQEKEIAARQELERLKVTLDRPTFIQRYLNQWREGYRRTWLKDPSEDEENAAREIIEKDYDTRPTK